MDDAEKRQMKDIENEENNPSDKSKKENTSKIPSQSPMWNGGKLFPLPGNLLNLAKHDKCFVSQ